MDISFNLTFYSAFLYRIQKGKLMTFTSAPDLLRVRGYCITAGCRGEEKGLIWLPINFILSQLKRLIGFKKKGNKKNVWYILWLYNIINKIIPININFIYDLYNIRDYWVTYYNLFWNINYNEIKYHLSDVMHPLHH